MRLRYIGMLLVAVASAAAVACGGSSNPSATPEPTIDVRGLTPSVIATRALAALQREGQVTHIREVQEGSSDAGTYDLWIDWAGKRVRLNKDGYATRVMANGTASFYLDQRSSDVPAGDMSHPEQVLNSFDPSPDQYLAVLRRQDLTQVTIKPASIDRHAAILANVTQPAPSPTVFATSPTHYRIYFDANFLLIRAESVTSILGGNPTREVSLFSIEFVSPSALPGDFFDKTAAFGIGQTPVQRLAFALDTGFTADWLGTAFENATLTGVSGEREASGYSSGTRVVTIDYTTQHDSANGLPCDAYLRNYPRAIWNEAVDQRTTGFDGEKPAPDKELYGFDVPGGRAQIMEEHRIDFLPPTPGATPTEWPTFAPSEVPNINDLRPLPPRGDVADTVGRLTTKDYVVEVHLRCRASAEAKTEPLKRILRALRPYPQ